MSSRKSIAANIGFVIMREEKTFVAYAPALDMSTCAATFDEVKKRADELVEIFFEETAAHGTLPQALKDLGWHLSSRKRGRPSWVPPELVGQTTTTAQIPLPA